MGRQRKEKIILTPFQKRAKRIGDDWEDVVRELESMSMEDLNKRIAQANQSISETKSALEQNEEYLLARENAKLLSSGFREVKKRQNAIIEVAVTFRKDKGAN